MQVAHLRYRDDFKIVAGNHESQAGVMVIAPGKKEGGPKNHHRGADQWLYIARGEGVVTIDGQDQDLKPGTLVLIERGENHEIRNTGSEPLETLNFYVPPAFKTDGDPLPAGER